MKHVWSPTPSNFLACAAIAATLNACGGGQTSRAESADEHSGQGERKSGGSGLSASAEIGALDEGKVQKTFQSALGDLQKCLAEGARRNELEGGDIAFFLKIDTSGSVIHAHAEKSTIGDRETEKCMLSSLKRKKWPEPQGGDVGLARNSYGFDMPNDVREPTAWDKGRVDATVAEISSKIDECKSGARAQLTATVYVDPEGAALSAGVSSSDESGEAAADCVVGVLKSAKYPSPGSWPAKVSFDL